MQTGGDVVQFCALSSIQGRTTLLAADVLGGAVGLFGDEVSHMAGT